MSICVHVTHGGRVDRLLIDKSLGEQLLQNSVFGEMVRVTDTPITRGW